MKVDFRKPPVRRVRVVVLLALALLAGAFATGAFAGMIAPGQPMPAFRLEDHSGAQVSSADFAGRSYLLWFYPKARTPGCTAEARGLRDQHAQLEAAGVTVLGVSFDDPAANRAFVEAEQLPFRLLSDRDRELAVAVGAADSRDAWFAARISYLVGPDGRVLVAYDDVDPATHAQRVLADSTAPAAPQARSGSMP